MDTNNILVAKYAQTTFVAKSGDTFVNAVRKFNYETNEFEEMPGSPDAIQQQELAVKLLLIAANWEQKGYKTISYITSVPAEDAGKNISQILCVYDKDTQAPTRDVALEGSEMQVSAP